MLKKDERLNFKNWVFNDFCNQINFFLKKKKGGKGDLKLSFFLFLYFFK